MFSKIINMVLYSVILMSLFIVDYVLGNGFVVGFRRVFCKFACYVKKNLRYDVASEDSKRSLEHPSIPVFVTELCILTFTMMMLNRYKRYRGKDRIDELLQESKDALKQTNEFLEKWRLRRVPKEFSYLDEEPQHIEPLKLEIPILHMAIIDTRGKNRKPERGDAGDTINITDSTLLSVTSLLGDDLDESVTDCKVPTDVENKEEIKTIEFKNRYLWDVMEEEFTTNNDDV